MRLTAGMVVVRREGAGWRYLFLRAYRNWDFPKGLVEPGEDPLAAARREVGEETGITDLEPRWGDAWCATAPYAGGKVARYYLAATAQQAVVLGVNPELGRPEHHEFRWVTPEELRHLAPARLAPVIAWAQGRIAGG